MKLTNARILATLLSLLLIVFCAIPTHASEPTDELTAEVIERVYSELLTGNITSTDDVLRVAVAQYEANHPSSYGTRSIGSSENDGNQLPRITQVVETAQDEDGFTTVLIADSGILLTDENGTTITTNQLINQGYNTYSQYSITAYHTVYYYYRYQQNGDELPFEEDHVKCYKMTTVVYYGSNYQATKLEHIYGPEVGPIPNPQLINVYYYPSHSTTYTDYTPNAAWIDASTNANHEGFSSMAVIYIDGRIMEIPVEVDSDTVSDAIGGWYFSPALREVM